MTDRPMNTRRLLHWFGRSLALGVLLGVLMFATYLLVAMVPS